MTQEGWDGVERREGELAQVRQELGSVRTALMSVAQGMASFAAQKDVDDAFAADRQERNKFNGLLITFIVVVLLAIGGLGFVIHQVGGIAHDNKTRIDAEAKRAEAGSQYGFNAVGCIVYRLYEHRIANEFAHHELAMEVGKDYKEPTDLTPPPTEAIEKFKDACDKFFAVVAASPTVERPAPTTVTTKK